ncbi:uncharacterized protein LOC144306245 [Canis aureus]
MKVIKLVTDWTSLVQHFHFLILTSERERCISLFPGRSARDTLIPPSPHQTTFSSALYQDWRERCLKWPHTSCLLLHDVVTDELKWNFLKEWKECFFKETMSAGRQELDGLFKSLSSDRMSRSSGGWGEFQVYHSNRHI